MNTEKAILGQSNPEQAKTSKIALLPPAPTERIYILGNKHSSAIVAKEECIKTAKQDLESDDADLTIEFLKQHYKPEELTARAQATRDFINLGNGPRELFNVFELANFLQAHVSGRAQAFKKLQRNCPTQDKLLKESLLRQMTGFSSLDSWASLVSAVEDKRLIVPHHASLSASLLYLGHKGVLPDFDNKACLFGSKKQLQVNYPGLGSYF